MNRQPKRVTSEELAAEAVTALPDKEVLSLLDLNANLDLALDTAAPIDLAVGANANIAAPIDAAVNANVLSPGAVGVADSTQTADLHQSIVGNADAYSHQTSTIDQGTPTTTDTAGTTATTTSDPNNLLNVNVNLNGDLHLASPIDGAVAANANAAAPIDASVSANIGSPLATSMAVAHQDAVIDQGITGDATAVGDQTSGISQTSSTP